MKSEKMIEKIKALFKTELEEVKTAEGAVLYADLFEVGEAVFIAQDEERIALPVGEYLLEDGRTIVVTEEGIIGEVKEMASEEEVVEEEMEEKEEPQTLSKEDVISIVKEVLSELDLEKTNKDEIGKQVTEMKKEITDKVVEMWENEPKEEAPKFNPEGRKKFGSKTNTVLGKLYNNY